MMGLRGVRLSIMMPEIVEMQVRAIFEAACDVALRGFDPHVEVMIPLTGTVNELNGSSRGWSASPRRCSAEKGKEIKYKFGTMIEIPRACRHRGRDRQAGRVLFFWYQRPDPDDVRLQSR